MIDIQLIRKDPGRISQQLKKRGIEVSFEEFLEIDHQRRGLIQQSESLKHQQNQAKPDEQHDPEGIKGKQHRRLIFNRKVPQPCYFSGG